MLCLKMYMFCVNFSTTTAEARGLQVHLRLGRSLMIPLRIHLLLDSRQELKPLLIHSQVRSCLCPDDSKRLLAVGATC